MTTQEKRNALHDFCNSHPCHDCPFKGNDFCGRYNLDFSPADIIDKWYELFFGTQVDEVPHIKDSGTRRQFDTGAVRDIQEGKGRCDLLPLDVVGKGLADPTLIQIQDFMNTGHVMFLYRALPGNKLFPDPHTLFLEVAKHFEEGCKKYGENNWQKGIPTHCYIDSAVRHYLKWLRGDRDEPHDRAFCWNILCCIWTCIHKPELNDYAKKDTTERCVSCGDEIPEGRQVCPDCEGGADDE